MGASVQLCGDAHLANFGIYASPERRLVFDLNDFDETASGPWEWDVKRLAASLVVASRENGFPEATCRDMARRVALRTYREAMRRFAGIACARGLVRIDRRSRADRAGRDRSGAAPRPGRDR